MSIRGLGIAVALLSMCCTPTATFLRTGEVYTRQRLDPEAVAVYMAPNEPERAHTVVGTIIVSPNRNVRNQEAYLNALREKAAEYGVDGVKNVEIKREAKKEASGGCISGTPYYYEDNYTLYEIRGEAFVWKQPWNPTRFPAEGGE